MAEEKRTKDSEVRVRIENEKSEVADVVQEVITIMDGLIESVLDSNNNNDGAAAK